MKSLTYKQLVGDVFSFNMSRIRKPFKLSEKELNIYYTAFIIFRKGFLNGKFGHIYLTDKRIVLYRNKLFLSDELISIAYKDIQEVNLKRVLFIESLLNLSIRGFKYLEVKYKYKDKVEVICFYRTVYDYLCRFNFISNKKTLNLYNNITRLSSSPEIKVKKKYRDKY